MPKDASKKNLVAAWPVKLTSGVLGYKVRLDSGFVRGLQTRTYEGVDGVVRGVGMRALVSALVPSMLT